MTQAGYVPIFRSLFERDDFLAPSKRDPANRGYAWAYMIALAQHEPYRHGGVKLARGELFISLRTLGKKLGWSKSRTARFIERLASETMIAPVRETPIGTVYRIVNYDTWRDRARGERDTERDTERDASGTHAGHMRDKNKNKEQITNTHPLARASVDNQLDALATRSIVGLYGWAGSEGTDVAVWRNVTDLELRDRCLTIAVQRLTSEGRAYNGQFFRRILETVIREQTTESSARSQSGALFDVPLRERDGSHGVL